MSFYIDQWVQYVKMITALAKNTCVAAGAALRLVYDRAQCLSCLKANYTSCFSVVKKKTHEDAFLDLEVCDMLHLS